MKKRLLYIGNKLSKKGNTQTSIETLGAFFKNEGYSVLTASSVQNKFGRLFDMMYKTVKNRNKIDVVLIDTYSTQNFYFAVYIAKLCRTFNIPYIPILRGGNLPARLKKSPKQSKKLFANAKTNIAPSNYLLDAFKKEGFTNITYIPNTIEIKKYPFLLRKEIKVKLLWVRSFAELYNPKLALEIVEELQKKQIDVSLCMVGPEKDGSLEECKNIAKEKNLPITFTGKLSKEEWINLSEEYTLFINTTNFDNMPVSVLEAMALGLPVISTNVGGIPYLIEDNKTGILVPANNVDVFVKAITELLSNPEKTETLSKNARDAVEQFDWEVVKEKWDEVLG
ncbi:MAG: glycosyltransferase family 4 protein [Flavobacteriaceae bacterium]|nr:glycosyltransferase family 4 protein [Flavobacteriaceae bacterium]